MERAGIKMRPDRDARHKNDRRYFMLRTRKQYEESIYKMRDNVYAEYVGTPHEGNRSGVPANC